MALSPEELQWLEEVSGLAGPFVGIDRITPAECVAYLVCLAQGEVDANYVLPLVEGEDGIHHNKDWRAHLWPRKLVEGQQWKLRVKNGAVRIADARSTNGSSVIRRGESVEEALCSVEARDWRLLESGDVIRCQYTRWMFVPARKHARAQEGIARDALRAVSCAELGGVTFELHGRGVHWRIDASCASRRTRIHCFQHAGPRGRQYALSFFDGDALATEGRSSEDGALIGALRAWLLERVSVSQMRADFDFIDAPARAAEALLESLNRELAQRGSGLRVVRYAGSASTHEYDHVGCVAGRRAVAVVPRDSTHNEVSFTMDHVVLLSARDVSSAELAQRICDWCERGVRVAQLTEALPRGTPDRFAELFEQGRYADWHWAHVRIWATEDPIYAFYAPIIALVEPTSHIARFFTFTSHDRWMFSRSSRYPYDDEGMPYLSPSGESGIPFALTYEGVRHLDDAAGIVSRLEQILSRADIAP